MKKTSTYLLLLLSLLAFSCEKAPEPISIDFGRTLYKIYVDGTTEVDIQLNRAAEETVSIPLTFSGKAEIKKDYSVSSESIQVQEGETSGSILIKNLALTKEKQIAIGLVPPNGFQAGNRFKAVVSLDDQEALIYQFKMAKANLHESYIAEIKLKGMKTGADFRAQEDILIPLLAEGEKASLLEWTHQNGGTNLSSPQLIVPAGSNRGQVKISCSDPEFHGPTTIKLKVNTLANPRLVPADQDSEQVLNLWGPLSADQLTGTWEFEKIYDLESLEMWFMEYEDDPSLLPTHNQGFRFTIRKGLEGYELIPNEKGDFSHFFRKTNLRSSSPKNGCSHHLVLGSFSLEEQNMFMEADQYNFTQNWYYQLDVANRSFDQKNEKLGKATICISMIDSNHLQLQLRDYDHPPFGTNYWGDDNRFDPELFGFASEFKKIKE